MDRAAMGIPSEKRRFIVVPNVEHILFLIRKGNIATKHLFDRIPKAKGCIAGPPGRQVWAIWYHRYYGHPDSADASNVLYIMRLVVEGDDTRGWSKIGSTERESPADQLRALESVIETAQLAAAEWRLQHVSVWDPTLLVQKGIVQTGLKHRTSGRGDQITSGRWYDADVGVGATPEWITDEYYSL